MGDRMILHYVSNSGMLNIVPLKPGLMNSDRAFLRWIIRRYPLSWVIA